MLFLLNLMFISLYTYSLRKSKADSQNILTSRLIFQYFSHVVMKKRQE